MANGLNIVNGDFVVNPNGGLHYITDETKCIRDFLKMMLTSNAQDTSATIDNGTYRYNPEYGNSLIGIKSFGAIPNASIIDSINMVLSQAIKKYVAAQDNRTDQSVGEIILAVNYETYFNPEDPQTVLIKIYITTPNKVITVGTFSQQVS